MFTLGILANKKGGSRFVYFAVRQWDASMSIALLRQRHLYTLYHIAPAPGKVAVDIIFRVLGVTQPGLGLGLPDMMTNDLTIVPLVRH